MKRTIWMKVGAVLSIAGILSGCAGRPEIKTENGISYALDDSVSAVIGNTEEMPDSYVTETKQGARCVCSLGTGDKKMNIDAPVSSPGSKQAAGIKAVPFPDAINREAVIKMFFGDETNVTEEVQEEESQSIIEGEERGVINKMPTTSQLALESVNGDIHFSRPTDADFYYSNDSLIQRYKQIELGECVEEPDADISEEYTASMAKEELSDTLHKISNMDIQIISGTAIYNSSGDGYYEFNFVPVLEGLPLAINDREMNTDNIIDVFGHAEIGKDGIALIEANNFLWRNTAEVENTAEECLSLEKVLKVLERYILDSKISCSSSVTFTKCEFVYLPVTDDWREAALTPVWRFYIPAEELIEKNVLDIAIEEDIPTDICINAVNGELENMQ